MPRETQEASLSSVYQFCRRVCSTNLAPIPEEGCKCTGGGPTLTSHFITSNYERISSVTSMLKSLGWESFRDRRWDIRDCTLQWIKGFLSGHTQQVLIEGKQSGSSPVTSSFPQCTVFGPILFLTFINDLPQWAQHSKIRLFADDCIILKEIRSSKDCLLLQQDINSIGKWEREWLMEFNSTKCQTLIIPTISTPILSNYHFHEVKDKKRP